MGLTSNKLYSGSPDIWSDRTYYRKKSFNARSKKCQGTVSKQMICLLICTTTSIQNIAPLYFLPVLINVRKPRTHCADGRHQ